MIQAPISKGSYKTTVCLSLWRPCGSVSSFDITTANREA